MPAQPHPDRGTGSFSRMCNVLADVSQLASTAWRLEAAFCRAFWRIRWCATLGVPSGIDVRDLDPEESSRVAQVPLVELAGEELPGCPEVGQGHEEADAVGRCLERVHEGTDRLGEGEVLLPFQGGERWWAVERLLLGRREDACAWHRGPDVS